LLTKSIVVMLPIRWAIALEVTRLSRNSPDWHHLLYLCRFSETLIADEDTIYDLERSSDRLVLGIRGQMGELESSIARMVSARWSKAERGELFTVPPAGYDLDECGQWVKSSDAAVVQALNTVFAKFDELGSARQVFQWWRAQGLTYPVRWLRSKVHHGRPNPEPSILNFTTQGGYSTYTSDPNTKAAPDTTRTRRSCVNDDFLIHTTPRMALSDCVSIKNEGGYTSYPSTAREE